MEVVQIPRAVWENMLHKLDFIEKAIKPLAAGYKPSKWMNAQEVMDCLEIGKERLKQLRASGQIRYQKPVSGRTIEYWRQDIESYKMGNIIITTKKAAGNAAGIQ